MARLLPHGAYAQERIRRREKHRYFAMQSVFTHQMLSTP